MTDVGHTLQDLNEAIERGSSESRAKALWHATDILVEGEFSEEQIRKGLPTPDSFRLHDLRCCSRCKTVSKGRRSKRVFFEMP